MHISRTKIKKSQTIEYRVMAENLMQQPSVFTIEKISTGEKFDLTASEIFRLNYIYAFSIADIINITYCYAEQSLLQT